MKPELKRAYDSGKLILFAGAGISRNFGLPEWHELIAHLANELGYDPKSLIPMARTCRWRSITNRKKVRLARCAAGWIANGIAPILMSALLKFIP